MTLPAADEREAIEALERVLSALNTARIAQGSSPDLMTRIDPLGLVTISGNTDGLLWLAEYTLRVARAEIAGLHEHIDAGSFALEGSVPLVVARIESDDPS